MRTAPAVLLLALTLVACSTESDTATAELTPVPSPPAASEDAAPTGSLAAREAQTTPSNTVEYDCEGLRITLAVEGEAEDARARFVVDGATLELPASDASQGDRFADADGNAFWRHGDDEARLRLHDQHERNCARVY
ncbi:MliC family protein [Luteimonas sp. 100069]|uniref:MliC family protein n=1 Tax=Luteimonas sp. 100069 TaxID=2006109 RepID=UPI000F4FEE16|nr:MliC family protein [Luteimonas sp. 100069]RPD88521.1 hypothetical protein EGK76_05075 [Luteimonas sp. 100069]